MQESAAHIIVRGLVQGVGFRYFVHQRARRLGIVGVVRNAPDGSVEIEVEGARSLLEELVGEVRLGPRASRVSDVSVTWRTPGRAMTEFSIQ